MTIVNRIRFNNANKKASPEKEKTDIEKERNSQKYVYQNQLRQNLMEDLRNKITIKVPDVKQL